MPPDRPASPRLSVIIAAWNAAATIGAAIESVLAQPEVPLECLVVDDGSTDATALVARSIAARDNRVVLLRSAGNEGVSSARNRALDAARGEWLAFLDADDRLLPGGLGAMLDAADASGAQVVVGQRISSDGSRTWFPALYDIPDIRQPGMKSVASHPGLLYYAGPAGKLFHGTCAQGLRFEGRMLGDQPWVIRAMLRAGDRIVVVDDVVYEWRRPARRGGRPTLTTSREGSALLASQAVAMAGTAYAVVAGEMGRTVDPASRQTLEAIYFGRLIRADLATQLWRAVQRGDPDIASLFEALCGLLRAVPGDVVAASDAVARGLIEPPLRSWYRISQAGRAAYWTLFRTAVDVDPALTARGSGRLGRLALRVAGRTSSRVASSRVASSRVAPQLAGVLLTVARVDRGVRRRAQAALRQLPARSSHRRPPRQITP